MVKVTGTVLVLLLVVQSSVTVIFVVFVFMLAPLGSRKDKQKAVPIARRSRTEYACPTPQAAERLPIPVAITATTSNAESKRIGKQGDFIGATAQSCDEIKERRSEAFGSLEIHS
jgi:hypothetical protein